MSLMKIKNSEDRQLNYNLSDKIWELLLSSRQEKVISMEFMIYNMLKWLVLIFKFFLSYNFLLCHPGNCFGSWEIWYRHTFKSSGKLLNYLSISNILVVDDFWMLKSTWF